MKKIILSVIALISSVTIGFSQLAVQDTTGATLSNGDTVYVNGVAGYQSSSRFFIYNSTKTLSANVICVPTGIAVSGCTYSICVGSACYKIVADNVNFMSPTFSVPAGKDTNALYTDYNPSAAGTTVIRYDVRTASASDSTWFFVKFVATPTSVPTITANNLRMSSLYPNPANSVVSFTYHTDYNGTMSIYNSLGQVVKTVNVSSAKESMSIDTSDMPSGVYICRLQATGADAAFRRLVVSH
jgi:hypothetical protein